MQQRESQKIGRETGRYPVLLLFYFGEPFHPCLIQCLKRFQGWVRKKQNKEELSLRGRDSDECKSLVLK